MQHLKCCEQLNALVGSIPTPGTKNKFDRWLKNVLFYSRNQELVHIFSNQEGCMVAQLIDTIDPEQFIQAVWRTENGGFVMRDHKNPGMYKFVVSPPSFPEYQPGHMMPSDWRIQAANKRARTLKDTV